MSDFEQILKFFEDGDQLKSKRQTQSAVGNATNKRSISDSQSVTVRRLSELLLEPASNQNARSVNSARQIGLEMYSKESGSPRLLVEFIMLICRNLGPQSILDPFRAHMEFESRPLGGQDTQIQRTHLSQMVHIHKLGILGSCMDAA